MAHTFHRKNPETQRSYRRRRPPREIDLLQPVGIWVMAQVDGRITEVADFDPATGVLGPIRPYRKDDRHWLLAS